MKNSEFEEIVRKQRVRGNGAKEAQWRFGFQNRGAVSGLKKELESLGLRVYLTSSGWFSSKVYYFRLVGSYDRLFSAINRVKIRGVDWK